MKPCRQRPKVLPIYPGLFGKVAVVTGASSGIGAETARYLAANMVTVVVNSRNRDKLNKVAAGAQVRVITCSTRFFLGRLKTHRRHVEVSSIVQIEAINSETASRVTNALMAAAKGRPEGDEPLRIDTIYDQERARLKVILTGSIASTASLLKFITAYLES